jgi:hypothetical protein
MLYIRRNVRSCANRESAAPPVVPALTMTVPRMQPQNERVCKTTVCI